MSSTETITVGRTRARVAQVPRTAEAPCPVDDRWPPLATVALVFTASAGLWVGIVTAIRAIV